MIVRTMQPEEIDLVVNLFNYYRMDADIDEDSFDRQRVLATVREFNIRPHLFFRVAYWGTRPVGLIGGFISQDPVEAETTATIQFCFLLEEYRQLDNYESLINEFSDWARSFNCSQLRVLDIGRHLEKLRGVYDQLEFSPVTVTILNKEL